MKEPGSTPNNAILFRDPAALDAFLLIYASTSSGIWLHLAKKPRPNSKPSPPTTTLTLPLALDIALTHGWINGQARAAPDPATNTVLSRFTPRRPRSTWSAINVAHVERLRAEGRMHPRGEEEVAKAQADGRWAGAYGGSEGMEEVLDEVLGALDNMWPPEGATKARNKAARNIMEGWGKGERYKALLGVAMAGTNKNLRKKRIGAVLGKVCVQAVGA
jgi:uncharacterized protein YdeI (YjbR/CyaY-like superfamily)